MLERAAFMHRHSACCSRPEEGTKHAALITILNHRRDSEADSSLISNFIAVSCSLKTKAQTTNNTVGKNMGKEVQQFSEAESLPHFFHDWNVKL